MNAETSPFKKTRGGVQIDVRLTPKASANKIDGLYFDSDGRAYLKVRITEAPEKGRANRALIKLLAKSMGEPPSALTLTSGEKDRTKSLLLRAADEPATRGLLKKLADWLTELTP